MARLNVSQEREHVSGLDLDLAVAHLRLCSHILHARLAIRHALAVTRVGLRLKRYFIAAVVHFIISLIDDILEQALRILAHLYGYVARHEWAVYHW